MIITNIDNTLNLMEKMLSLDILTYIYHFYNIDIIKKQKILKKKILIDIKKLFNIYYYDENILMYLNENNNMVLRHLNNNTRHIQQIQHIMPLNENEYENDNENQNQIVNINNNNTDIILFNYNDIEQNMERKINIYIVYV